MLYEHQHYEVNICGYLPFCVYLYSINLFETKNTSFKNIINNWQEKNALIVMYKGTKAFYNKNTECKNCNSDRSLKLYYEDKDKLSNQRNLYFEKK